MSILAAVGFVVFLCSIASSQDANPIITTPMGDVMGVQLTNDNGRTYYGFRGMPFAQPPVGDLRWETPQPIEAWTDVFNATTERFACFQMGSDIDPDMQGGEDCLYINVYIPELPTATTNRSVMVWFYAGAFVVGSTDERVYGTGRFMNYDVITVTFGYRLGSIGFLSMADQVIPGNYGTWDQVHALRWVQNNIASFGGNPESVTIFGESAGGLSTSIMFLSPQTEGLFHAVISESPTLVWPWMYQPDPVPYAQQLAEAANCPSDDSTLMLACLRNLTAMELYQAELSFDPLPTNHPLLYCPVIDSYMSDGVLPVDPMYIIINQTYNKVPYITGIMTNEGLGMYVDLSAQGQVFDADYARNNLSIMIQNFTYMPDNQLAIAAPLIYEEYFGGIDMDNASEVEITFKWLLTDLLSNPGNFLMMDRLPKGEGYPPFYNFLFSYNGEYMYVVGSGQTTHGDEMVYLFDIAADNGGLLDEADNTTSERMLTLWTTFAKTGNPNPVDSDLITVTWDAVSTQGSIPYLQIDTELSMQENYRWEKMLFWNNSILPIVWPELA